MSQGAGRGRTGQETWMLQGSSIYLQVTETGDLKRGLGFAHIHCVVNDTLIAAG